jgi:hypothetical protein
MLNGQSQRRRSSLPPWAGRQSSRGEIPPPGTFVGPERTRVFVTSVQASGAEAHSQTSGDKSTSDRKHAPVRTTVSPINGVHH